MERLQKVLARAGVASRRKSEVFIKEGRVKINGRVTTELGVKVNPVEDRIEVDGKNIREQQLVCFLFHKPVGVITSVEDPQGRKVVLDYFRHVQQRIYPVGRLDYDTSGLLLLTNDGDLAFRLMHPSFQVQKTYVATLQGMPTVRELKRLEQGIILKDGPTAPAQVKEVIHNDSDHTSTVRLIIHEGRKRQVRRMFKWLGYPVLTLHREKFAFLDLEGVAPGEYRSLTEEEINGLHALAVT